MLILQLLLIAMAVVVSCLGNNQLAQLRISKLERALQIATVSHKNYAYLPTIQEFHKFLKSEFPLSHSTNHHHPSIISQYQIINGNSLVYTLFPRNQATGASVLPALFCAHIDVVSPGTDNDGTLSKWSTGPFQGRIIDGYLYGRGALDFKNGVIGLMQAIEELLNDSAATLPRPVVVALGHDEEITGKQGAAQISKYFQTQTGSLDRFEFIMDEGSPVLLDMVPMRPKGTLVAAISIAEKGYLGGTLKLHAEPGHSSLPRPEGTLLSTLLPRILLDIDSNLLSELPEPTLAFFEIALPAPVGWLFGMLRRYPTLNSLFSRVGLVKLLAYAAPNLWPLMSTTFVVTRVSGGGTGENVIPSEVELDFNVRLLTGDSSQRMISVIESVLKAHGFKVIKSDNANSAGVSKYAQIITKDSHDPSPISPTTQSATFQAFQELARNFQFREPVGGLVEKNLVAPILLTGATDTKHYENLSDHIFRFSPLIMNRTDLQTIHGINERISVDSFSRQVDFYKQAMLLKINQETRQKLKQHQQDEL